MDEATGIEDVILNIHLVNHLFKNSNKFPAPPHYHSCTRKQFLLLPPIRLWKVALY